MSDTRLLHFILNDQPVCIDQPPGLTVLEFLRDTARLTGTKAATTIAERLAPQSPPDPPVTAGAVLVAGGTDLFVQQPERIRQAACRFLSLEEALRGIAMEDGWCAIGAATTVEEMRESPLLQACLPSLWEDFDLFFRLKSRCRVSAAPSAARRNRPPPGQRWRRWRRIICTDRSNWRGGAARTCA